MLRQSIFVSNLKPQRAENKTRVTPPLVVMFMFELVIITMVM